MGLWVSHDCWTGSYRKFAEFRRWVARCAGLPPLEMMEGHYRGIVGSQAEISPPISKWSIMRALESLPISWSVLRPDPLNKWLMHSDCDGDISWAECGSLAERMQELLDMPNLPETGVRTDWDFKDCLAKWINGLRVAHDAQEGVLFG